MFSLLDQIVQFKHCVKKLLGLDYVPFSVWLHNSFEMGLGSFVSIYVKNSYFEESRKNGRKIISVSHTKKVLSLALATVTSAGLCQAQSSSGVPSTTKVESWHLVLSLHGK